MSCKEGWILWSPTATMASPPLPGLLWAEEVKALSPGPPPTVLQLGFLLVVQPQVVVVLYRFCQQTTYLWGLHPVSKAPSEFCQKGDRAASMHSKGPPSKGHPHYILDPEVSTRAVVRPPGFVHFLAHSEGIGANCCYFL